MPLHVSCQCNTDGFESFCLPGCAAHRSISAPCRWIVCRFLPSVALHMGCVADATRIRCIRQFDLNSFESLCLSGCAAHRPVIFPALPAIALHMGTICNIRAVRTRDLRIHALSRRRVKCICKLRCDSLHIPVESRTLLHDHDLNALQTLRITCGSCRCAICRPAKPAVALRMHAVIDIIFILVGSGQLDLDCFQTFCFPLRAVHVTVRRPRQPAIVLAMRRVLDSYTGITGYFDFDSLQSFRFSGSPGHHAVLPPGVLPSEGLDVRAVRHRHIRRYNRCWGRGWRRGWCRRWRWCLRRGRSCLRRGRCLATCSRVWICSRIRGWVRRRCDRHALFLDDKRLVCPTQIRNIQRSIRRTDRLRCRIRIE